jgi:colicin import membrane protein
MNEVEIPLKLSGIGAIKAELRELKGAIADATDPADIARLSQRAGELKDQLSDANEAVNTFATGSKFEQVSNSLGGIKDSLLSLDFDEAAQKANVFKSTLGNLDPKAIGGAFKSLTSVIMTVGSAFVSLGATILANPIFLLIAVIIAIVAAIVIFLHKIGVLQKVLDFLMIPINALIQGLKDLGDWLGLTSYAADENAERMAKANEKVAESSKKRSDALSENFDQEIAMAKIAGKDTTQLELDKSRALEKESIKRKAAAKKALDAMAHQEGEEAIKKRQELRKQIDAENKIIKTGVNERKRIKAQELADQREADKKAADDAAAEAEKAADKAAAAAEKARERAKQAAKNRLDNARTLRDFELSQIQDANAREVAIVNEKYARLMNDLKTDANKTVEEKAKFNEMFRIQQQNELNKLAEDKAKTEADNLKKGNDIIADLQLQLMEEGTEKELAMTKAKYDKLRAQTLADVTLTEEQKKTLTDLYNQQEEAENQKRADAKLKQQQTLAKTLADAELTEDEKKLQALQIKYEEDYKLAEGNAALQLALAEKLKDDKQKIEDDARKTSIENDKKERDARLQIASDIANGINTVGAAFIKDQKKLEKFNKANALIQIGIDTAKAISSLVAASQANPLNGVTGGAAGIAQFATGIIQIATNVAKAKQILTSGGTPTSGGGGGGGNEGGGSSVAQSVPQGAQLFGSANTGNVMSAGGGTSNSSMTVTAVVSETQITNVQNKITKINKNAEL